MQIIEEDDDDFLTRVSFERRRSSCSYPFHPLLLVDGLSRKSFSFNKLNQEPLKLTVIKLDGSTFEVEVAKMATVAELKQAVEAVFSHLPKTGIGKVSWPHVWGHFCLSYDGQKLVIDSEHIAKYGIKDGDQLHFIRHLSISYNLRKKQSNEQDSDTEHPRLKGSEDRETDTYKERDQDDQENLEYDEDDDDVAGRSDLSIPRFLGCWFSYHRLSSPRKRSGSCCFSSEVDDSFLGSFKSFFRLYNNKIDTQKDAWKDV